MSPDSRTVSQIPSFCNCNCILKDFHDFWDFHLLWEFYGQYSHSKEGYLASIPKHSLSITIDKSCRHWMHFHFKVPSLFLHSLFPISVDEITSLLPFFLSSLLPYYREKKSYICTRSYYHIWHSNLYITVMPNRNWSDHSLQAPQISSFRSKDFYGQGLGFLFQVRNISILLWQCHITWPQIVMSKSKCCTR